MAKKLAQVLKTDIMGTIDLPSLAKIVQSKGRKGDTVLAHITRKEAEMLKRRGGAGTTNPETGLPEFFDGEDFYGSYEPPIYIPTETPVVEPAQFDYAAGAQPVAPEVMSQFQSPQSTADYFSGYNPAADYFSGYNPAADLPSYGAQETGGVFDSIKSLFPSGGSQSGTLRSATGEPLPIPRGLTPEQASDYYTKGTPTFEDPGVQTQVEPLSEEAAKVGGAEDKGIFGKMDLSDLLKLGVGGIGALMGRSQQQAAIKQAAADAQQYKDAAAAAAQQYKDLAQPLIGPGYSALSQAQQGALTAANRQAYDIARARAAQASARSGGVGAVQTAMEEGRMYQQLISTQMQQAMQLIAPGNSLAQAAISTTLAGTQGALQLQLGLEQQANQAAMNMYSALAKMVA